MGIAVRSIEETLASFTALLGYELYSGPFVDPIQRVEVCFLKRPSSPEDPVLELVAPAGDDSPVEKVLERGGGGYHVCFEVEELEEAIKEARAASCLVINGPHPAVAFEGRRIVWLYTPAKLLVELVEK
ncbi:MAG: VOC family protein [Gemmatimonadetes bacterium]|nr:VOC family protein [Gemmatimonadota bacterium]